MIDTNLNTILARQIEPAESCPADVWVRADDGPSVWQHILHATYYLQS
jgi:hypothetical protein